MWLHYGGTTFKTDANVVEIRESTADWAGRVLGNRSRTAASRYRADAACCGKRHLAV